jgi:FixJ family two-component response regulator
LVDRDQDHRRQVIELVQAHGWETLVCDTVDDFHQCVDPARTGCVLLDSGATHDDAQRLRDALRGAHLSVVLLASEPAQLPTVRWIAGREVAVLGKPVAEQCLRHCLEDVLLRSAAEAERRRWLNEVEARFRSLAPQDREVLRLVLEGQKNATIAKRLAVSLRTVENRRRRCFHVMQANSLTDLTRTVVLYEHGAYPSVEVHGRWCSLPFDGPRS